MLFTSLAFAFAFLPLVFAGFFLIARSSQTGAAAWLFGASLFFYGYWMPAFTALLVASICMNFFVGVRIGKTLQSQYSPAAKAVAKRWLIAGLSLNLVLLAYFKYANFFVDSLNTALGFDWNIGRVVLPIGISFFTFTQIAFIADAYQKGIREYKFIHYGLFVTYFPHLVAGPVLHHAQMMPQFGHNATYRLNASNIAGGLAIFSIGLFKKIVLADGVSPYADTVFDASDKGAIPTQTEAWLAALAYTFQLYFDFSGYSDMAIGLSLLFNIKLPFNFDSPYRAFNITEFWRRWHMTLSAFLRDYLYIPLGGNRHGAWRRYGNLFTTMLLGGLWHGANWTFVFWGGLHGTYLAINHGFQAICARHAPSLMNNGALRIAGWALTLLAVIVAWVFFRATTFSGATSILQGMAGTAALSVTQGIHPLLWNAGLDPERGIACCLVLGVIAFLMPNSNRIGIKALAVCQRSLSTRAWLMGFSFAAALLLIVVNATRSTVSPFIYFNF
jgi:alginate O-acetyltransferase complex protein AlgI